MDDAAERAAIRGSIEELAALVEWADAHLDREVAEQYKDQPLAQDWARVAKVTEEAGEAIDALIGVTGQNPRKGVYGDKDDLLSELADVALTGLYAIQHFTKDKDETVMFLLARAKYHRSRIERTHLSASQPTADHLTIGPPSIVHSITEEQP